MKPCPECGEPITPDYVDIGVGNLPMPDRCDACGWGERVPTDAELGLKNVDEEDANNAF